MVLTMDVVSWIQRELRPRRCTSVEFIYDDLDSQSDRCLPIIYQPFDAGKKAHWRDRGSLYDFLFSTGGGRLLDFGPGDGWPSLIVAPFVAEVVGVDASYKRVAVCTANARRLGIPNAWFIYCPPGEPLPFKDGSFDGVMAASSLEQTPDPQSTLHELYRITRTGGRLRIAYEALNRYRGGHERQTELLSIDDRTCRLILYDRDVEREQARQLGLTVAASKAEVTQQLAPNGGPLTVDAITVPSLMSIQGRILDATFCELHHPSGTTLSSWMQRVGFRNIITSHSGAEFAGRLFEQLPEAIRPNHMTAVDDMLRPLLKIVVQMPAALNTDPMITASK